MIYHFGQFELDTRRAELRCGADTVPLEPMSYSLLCLLVGSNDRLVSKDEIVEKVWDGRFISDSAISTGIKTVRRALGDSGDAQKFVKTLRGRGFRFVTPVHITTADETEPHLAPHAVGDSRAGPDQDPPPAAASKPAIAILPFRLVGHSDDYGAIADAIPAELISSLSRLRWLTVVARGSTFRFRVPEPDLTTIHRSLGAGYCMSGEVEIFGTNLVITVELADTRTQSVVWSERFPIKIDEVHQTRSEIVDRTVAALELHIPLHEASQARLRAPERLDAWSIYHIGLQHMFRFNRKDNEIAAEHFARATQLDPNFARAFAGRSFTSFQKAFLKNSADLARDIRETRAFAEKSVELDPLDPFGNFTIGRAFWLEGDPDGGIEWLDRAVSFSPNFAQGYYAHAWADVMAGRGHQALGLVDKAMTLSPLDPFLYAMQATRAFAHVQDGDYPNAAKWAERGARAPGAHFLIGAIAVAAHALNGDGERAGYWARNVRTRRPDASIAHFFEAFPFKDTGVRDTFTKALAEFPPS